MKNRYRSYRAYAAYRIGRLFEPLRKLRRFVILKLTIKQREMVMTRLANLKPSAMVELSQEESVLIRELSKHLLPSRLVTRAGKVVHMIPELSEVTLWQMIEARRAETAIERIVGWCGGYAPDTVADMVRLSKFIEGEINTANELERALLPGSARSQGTSDPISEAKAVLGLLQITAELSMCSKEDAKKENYSDAMLAISKRNDEVERLKSKKN